MSKNAYVSEGAYVVGGWGVRVGGWGGVKVVGSITRILNKINKVMMMIILRE